MSKRPVCRGGLVVFDGHGIVARSAYGAAMTDTGTHHPAIVPGDGDPAPETAARFARTTVAECARAYLVARA